MRFSLIFIVLLNLPGSLLAKPVDLDEETRRIASELRCAVCQNLSLADSPSELAGEMRQVILERLKEGKTPDEIKAYFVSKYGEWILLAPTAQGLNLLIWVLPFVVLVGGVVAVGFLTKRWVRTKRKFPPAALDRPLLLQEKTRLDSDLQELDFDYQAGRLSEIDYADLRKTLETETAAVTRQLESSPGAEAGISRKDLATLTKESGAAAKKPYKRWQLASAGAFLLLFGVTLGVALTKSVRPRGSESGSITGDFLTGTDRGGLPTLLARGRTAFENQQWPEAIDAFKKALAIDPNQPEAHAYMGLILTQAGHADGALLAFDRALSADPNFPLALWGKGLALFHGKKDYSSARATWERLLTMVPVGEERDNLQKLIADAKRLENGGEKTSAPATAGLRDQGKRLEGTIMVPSSLQAKISPGDTLFIIVRRAHLAEGPPQAVKKIPSPHFPLKFSIGPEDAMMPGVPFDGKMEITARIDKDGNPATKSPGDLVGVYRKNPVEVGRSNIEIVIDREL